MAKATGLSSVWYDYTEDGVLRLYIVQFPEVQRKYFQDPKEAELPESMILGKTHAELRAMLPENDGHTYF